MRACRRTSVMGKLGIEDVEEWLKLTDKDGVWIFMMKMCLFYGREVQKSITIKYHNCIVKFYISLISKHWIYLATRNNVQNWNIFLFLSLVNFLQYSFNIFFEFSVRYLIGLISLVVLILQNPWSFEGPSDPVISPGLVRQDLNTGQPKKIELRQSQTKQ